MRNTIKQELNLCSSIPDIIGLFKGDKSIANIDLYLYRAYQLGLETGMGAKEEFDNFNFD